MPVYAPLQAGQIRLVSIQCLPGSSRICIKLETYMQKRAPPYETLSYCWGNGNNEMPVVFENTTLYLSRNLHAALVNLLPPVESRILWIDALCINQEDSAEKSNQVAIMKDIFHKAERVLIWLGEEDYSTLAAFEAFSDIHLNLRTGLSESLTRAERQMDAIDNLLSRPYFQRVWVLQEIVVSRDALVLCGSCSISWDAFKDCVVMLNLRRNASEHIVSWIQNFTVIYHDVQDKGDKIGLSPLLIGTRSCQATDPRDKVFALLGLTNDHGISASFSPDYSISAAQTYTAATRFIIRHEEDLTILAGAGTLSESLDLPSWVPDWRLQPRSKNIGFDGSPGQPWWRYSAALSTSPSVCDVGDPQILSIKGFDVDVIESLSGLQAIADLQDDIDALLYIEMPRLINQLGIPNEDRYPFAEGDYAMACIKTLATDLLPDSSRLRDPMDLVYLNPAYRIMMRDSEEDCDKDSIAVTCLDRICSYIATMAKGRKFFVTKKGYVGLGPEGAEPADLVTIFLGGNVPFVIRKAENGFLFLGDSYVHGLMDGEALNGSYKDKVKSFVLI